MGGGTNARTVASFIPMNRPKTRFTTESTWCASPMRSAQGLRLTNMVAPLVVTELDNMSWPHMETMACTSGCCRMNSSISWTTALVRSNEAPCGRLATIMK